MAKRGEVARENCKNTIISAFGANFVDVIDKKIYVESRDESGEMIQFAITMTMPKTPIGKSDNAWEEGDFDSDAANTPVKKPPSTEISKEEEDKVKKLMKTLGICD